MIQFDCHAHVYEQVCAVPGARYVPERAAPLEAWLGHLSDHCLTGGVIVQVSFLGTDNSELRAALAKLDRQRFAGVGVVSLDVSDAELAALAKAGVRGVRWNLVGGAAIPDVTSPAVQRFLGALRNHSMHLEVHLEGPRLAPLLPRLADAGVDLVIDHFGLPSEPDPAEDPLIRAVSRLQERQGVFFKFSARYRLPFDIRPHAENLLDLLHPDHVLWGSDWPHTRHETQTSYSESHSLSTLWPALTDQVAAKRLYGICAGV
ncbi:amidohydrolase family protein [Pseudooceanicola sp. 216_PA32_1]|uniref:Amidohydrolase family protein n=1 Tax=Pseudooceanicola pacificus TaxID=2676438 RepID=A0A844W2D8_9RHOB|nr:amidohydrolase family protein [Pseudooceanicola pacificus]MWB78316.1 amidohydrolase family protein [Pseudooceanicola pacificus]